MSESVRADARALWLPVTAVLGIVAVVFAAGMSYKGLSDNADSAVVLAEKVESMSRQLSEVQGTLNTVVAMQAQLSDVKAEVGSLESRFDGMETRLQTMDAWIQTTRSKMQQQGFEPPPYHSGQRP